MLGAVTVAASGCDDARPASEGSTLDGPRTWQVNLTAAHDSSDEAGGEWVWPEELLPADVLSVTVLGASAGASRLTFGIRDNAARLVVDATAPELSPNRVLRGRSLVVAMIPSSSAALPLAANYRVSLKRLDIAGFTPEPGSSTVSVWIKRRGRRAAVPARQELPLAIFLVGPVVKDDERLAIALAELGRIWRAAGIEAGEPTRVRIAGEEAARFERLVIDASLGTDSPELGALLRLSERAPDGTLALFLVPDIVVSGPGSSVWAISGAIPVPPARGTIRSGVAVSHTLIELDPVYAGQAMAHEIGHALGLYHTTEAPIRSLAAGQPPGAIHDPIDDSPSCPVEADSSPRDGILAGDECEPFDAANLMFWSSVRHGTQLTAGQGEIARRSALAR